MQGSALALAVVLALAGGAAEAQLSTATVQGQVSSGTAPAAAGVPVVAVNTANGNTYRTTTRSDGSYVLPGLAPGSYRITVGAAGAEQKTEVVTLLVGQTASVDLALGAANQQVTIVGAAQRLGVRTSEVGTNVSSKQLESLPQVTRNFLAFADLAPGVKFNVENNGQQRLQGGAQNQDNVNVFIDGVGQKNYILRGGIAGLDSTRGNAFPQSAIAEYRVITQNYKAEFDQVSSTAITAVTKSGTNELHGEVYIDRTGTSWTAKDPFEKKAEANGIKRPDAVQKQYGFAVGGPIKQDTLHFFIAYDGKDIEQPRQVILQSQEALPNAGIMPSLRARQGSTVQGFKEDLVLARFDAQINADNRLDLSIRTRDESDRVPESELLSLPGNEKDRKNKENRITLRHEWTRPDLLSEARLGYEDYTFNPSGTASGPLLRYKDSPTTNLNNTKDVAWDGGSPDMQFRKQKGVFISEDLTYTGLAGHTMKGGMKLKELKFDLSGTSRAVDMIDVIIDRITGNPYLDAANANCTGTNPERTQGRITKTDQCKIDLAIAPAGVSFKTKQFGLYFQDDWRINKHLELNLGLRWDYEDNALNDDYVTPADRVAALFALDTTREKVMPAPGQTYAQSLAKGGINISDYIADGKSRKAFNNAWQPRLGFSYDLKGDRSTVVFGGAGRAYDRAMANHALDEMQKNAQPNGEIWLIKNDHAMPFTDQFSLGVRQAAGVWNLEVAATRSHAKNQFNWFHGNRDPNGGYGYKPAIDPLWGGPAGYGSVVLGDFVSEAKTDSIYLKADKPYTTESGWAVSFAYTYSDAKTTNRQWTNDIFNWTYGKPGQDGWHPSLDVDKHRVIATALTDRLIPWGVLLSGKLTYGSGSIRQVTDCTGGFDGSNGCFYRVGEKDNFKQVDLGLAKEVALPFGRVTLRLDVLNVFNTVNYGGYDDWVGGPSTQPKNVYGGDNANFGTPNSRGGPMRTYKLGLSYKW